MNITQKITQKIHYSNKNSYRYNLRVKRLKPLLEIIERTYQKYGEVNLIDIGGNKRYWSILPEEYLVQHKVKITVINLPSNNLPPEEEHFKFISGDGCNLAFDDDSFQIAHSNSVIEHVGDWSRMIKFATEIERVAPNYFIQTPYYWFPVEPHFMTPFFHWLPKPLRVSLIMNFALGYHKRKTDLREAVHLAEHARLIDKRMFKELFPEALFSEEKVFGLTKSLIAVKEDNI